MLFHSPVFIAFLIVTVLIYYMFPRGRLWIMAVANSIFYGMTGIGYLALFFGVVGITYLLSRCFHTSFRKLAFAAALMVVIGNLVFFKYSLFLLRNVESLLHLDFNLKNSVFADLFLPIGISFYTFQLIAYIVDVYKGKLQPSRSLLEFWVFISFFGHSMAGPILRGDDFLPQLNRIQQVVFQPDRMKLGIAYILMGLSKKILLADQIAPIVNAYFSQADPLTGGQSWVAAYLFAFQIYFDFSAYSEMAVGIGHLLGLRLDLNFKTPYLSASATEFWKRWHITLSQWIRDYIYIPVGGSRVSLPRSYFNLLFAMTVSGIWHGAAWTFVIWGAYHGVLSAAHRIYRKALAGIGWDRSWFFNSRLYHVICVFVFFHLVVIGWVFFRANSLNQALHMIDEMLTSNPVQMLLGYKDDWLIVLGLYLLHMAEYWVRKHGKGVDERWRRWIPSPLRATVYAAILIAIIIFMQNKHSEFIYFQF